MMSNERGATAFGLGCLFVAVIWLLVLPRVARWPQVRARIERNQGAGINPTAVFYTEHPMTRDLNQRIEERMAATR